MALPIDVYRKAAQAGANAIQNAAKKTGVSYTPTKTNTAAAASSQPSGLSWTDPATGQKITVTPAGQGGYLNAYSIAAQRARTQADEYQKKLQSDLAENQATTNANYDSAQRQAYVDYMRKQKALPSQLQALGVRGGATESGLLNLYNNYGAEHAAAEQQRAAELAANNKARNDAWYEYKSQLDRDLADREQTAINNQINEYKNDLAIFQNSVARYPTTEKGYNQYKDLIKSLKNGSDPLKDYKIALVQQQMASQFPKGLKGLKENSGGSGGGGGGGSRRSGGGGGYSSGSGSGGNNSSKAKAQNKGTAYGPYLTTVQKGNVLTKKTANKASRKAGKYTGHAR